MDLLTVLSQTVSSNQEELVAASTFIETYIQQDFPGFLRSLTDILHNDQNPPVVRMAAGLQLKNQLTSRDELLRQQQHQRWLALPEDTRGYVKQRVFASLGTETFRPSSAPQCVSYIAIVELPLKLWPGLVSALCHNVTNPPSSLLLRQATLETIGYICTDLDPAALEVSDSNLILTAIVHGMREEETNNSVRLAATTALLNSLEFTETNFQNEQERHCIMEVVCKATQCEDIQVSVAALQCLVKIMSLYYQFMEHYMASALFAITMKAMRSDNDDVALQGIEFWSNVCDEEINLSSEAAEAQELGRPPERTSKHYARGALQYLVPTLVEMLARQDENDDTEDWKPCKAAGVCLMLLANCCENAIVGIVLPFIQTNIVSQNWRLRDAAVMTFGSILDGPDQATLKPIAEQIVPFLINFMKDASVQVRDSSAWSIGKLCDTVPEAVLSQQFLPELIHALIENLKVEPRVAANVCWAINSLASAAGETAREAVVDDMAPPTFILSPFYPRLIEELLKTTERQDSNTNSNNNEHNLKTAAYEALMEVIKSAPADCYHLIYSPQQPAVLNIILQRVQYILSQEPQINNPTDRAQYIDLQCLLWASMTSIIRRMNKEDVISVSDSLMELLLRTLQTGTESGTVQEDAFMAIITLLDSITTHFLRYMESFKPYLIQGLRNNTVPQVCSTAIGLLGDLSRALGTELFPYCTEFMNVLMANLGEEAFDRNSKAQILSTFGDFALAFGPSFIGWAQISLTMLQHASQVQPHDRNDYEFVEYCIKLRECAIEGYTGIIQGLKGDENTYSEDVRLLLEQHIPHIVQFIILVASDPDITDSLICSCCGLIGDIAETFGATMCQLLSQQPITDLLGRGRRSRVEKTHSIANWASIEVRRLSQQGNQLRNT